MVESGTALMGEAFYSLHSVYRIEFKAFVVILNVDAQNNYNLRFFKNILAPNSAQSH